MDESGNKLNNASYEERKRLLEEIREIERESSRNIATFGNFLKNNLRIQQNVRSLNKDIKLYQDAIKTGLLEGNKLSEDEIKLLQEKVKQYELASKYSEDVLKNTSKTKIALKSVINTAGQFVDSLNVYDFLMESDKALKQMNLSLGVSGSLASTFRENIEGAAFEAARLGITIADLAELQMSFVDETGRLSSLSSQASIRLSAAAKASQLGADGAGQFAGYFDSIGKSAESTANFIESTLNSSESMGISGTKTVKLMASNFEKMNKLRFQGGVEAFRKMVQFSQITKQNLEGVFTAAEKFRTLEGAIEASAELQTLGGNMAKVDAFQMGFLARNDPEQFAKKLNEMTKGVYTFNKSTGQFAASAVDLDRLRRMAEITGQDYGELVNEAKKASQLDFMKQQMFGLSDEDKTSIAQMSQLNEKTKTFQVTLDGKQIDIDKITQSQAKLLRDQQMSLEERTKASQTFDETYQNTLLQLKTALLPILTTLNKLLNFLNELGPYGSMFGILAGGALISVLSKGMGGITSKLAGGLIDKAGGMGGMLGGGKGGAIASAAPSALANTTKAASAAQSLGGGLTSIPPGPALMSKAAGIAAIGVAAVGIGAGIWLAAKGVTSIAEAFKSLTPEQMNGVNQSLIIMGATMAGLGIVGAIAGKGLLIAGAGVVLIGGGVWLAAQGVAALADSMSKISTPDIGENVLKLGMGVGTLAASSALLANPLSLFGLAALSGFVNSVDGIDFTDMNQAFQNANSFMSAPTTNLDRLKEVIQLLNDSDTSFLKDMKDLFNKPLQVEFKEKTVNMVINITNEIDGTELGRKLQIGRKATIDVVNARRGT